MPRSVSDERVHQTFDAHTAAFYNSTAFQQKQAEVAQFLIDLKPYMDNRPVTLQNMVSRFRLSHS